MTNSTLETLNSLIVKKTQWEKEKMLVTSIFAFSNNVFKSLLSQDRENQGLFGKELNLSHTIPTSNDPDKKKTLWKYCAKKEKNGDYEHFLLFSQCFLPFPEEFSVFEF